MDHFERMQGYAIFRLAATILGIRLMTLSIVLFNFYPITAERYPDRGDCVRPHPG